MLDRPADLEGQIAALHSANLATLRLRWRTLMRKAFPEHLPRYLIINMLAYRLQAEVHGDLGEAEKKYLAQIAQKPGDAKAIPRFGDDRPHQVGTVFVREHGGVVHRVVTTEKGFSWQGNEYASLSAVASAITGTNWNGLRFFGVKTAKATHNGR